MLTKLFEAGRNIEVVGTARNGADGVKKCGELDPDVVTMDVEMPEMTGLEALAAIREAHGPHRPAVLMCSTLTDAASTTALDALRLGASDVIAKDQITPNGDTTAFQTELVNKVRAIGIRASAARRGASAAARPQPIATPATAGQSVGARAPEVRAHQVDVIAIGSSTGGPPVLEAIIESLPSAPTRPILIAQHMPMVFTRSLASRLDAIGPARVVLAEDGARAEPGTVYIAEGGKHLRAGRAGGGLTLEVSPEPADALYKPAVNELFASVAAAAGKRALGVVLTGMGDDGLLGAREMAMAGSTIVAQNEATCVVYGMPRAITEAGVSKASLPPPAIAACIAEAAGCRGGTAGWREAA